jgi:hypothetical protein
MNREKKEGGTLSLGVSAILPSATLVDSCGCASPDSVGHDSVIHGREDGGSLASSKGASTSFMSSKSSSSFDDIF